MTLFFLLLINLLSTYFVCSFLKNLSIFFIIYFASIVLKSEILSIFSSFNETNILILSIVEFFFLFLFFILKKKHFYFPNIKEELLKIKNAFKLDKMLFVTVFAFGFMLISFLILAFFVPPLEPDSRLYHFVRIFHYIKQANFSHFDTNQIRNTIMPINSEIIYSYFYLFKKSDLGFGFLSYFSFLTSIFQIYLILKTLKISIRKRLFTIFSLSSMGAILVQIPSCQTDIVISALSLTSIQLLLKKDRTSLFLSSLSYALAIGTKTTALLLFPAFLLLLFYILKNKKIILYYLIFLVFNFLIFSSYNYILNFVQFGDFVSPQNLKFEHKPFDGEIFSNFLFFIKDFLGQKIAFLFHLPKNSPVVLFDERTVGFSFLGCFLFLPAIFYSVFLFFKTKNKTHKLIGVFSFTFILNFVLICAQFTYSPYIVRYFVTFVLLSGFCVIYFYRFKIFKNLILVFCILNLIFYSIYSTRYPLHYFLDGFDKTTIMLKKQKDLAIYVQYKFLNIFKNEFKKQDKIAILDDIDFYEIKQLMNFGYNIDVLVLDKIDKNVLSYYDYLIFRYYNEFCDNSLYFDTENSKFNCEYKARKQKDSVVLLAKRCFFDGKFLNDSGFYFYKEYKVENKNFYVYKNSKNNIEAKN